MDALLPAYASHPPVVFNKPVALLSTSAIFVFELYLNCRQARLLASKKVPCPPSTQYQPQQHSTLRLWGFFTATILILRYDLVPIFWTKIEKLQAQYLPAYSSEFWKSSLFLLACCIFYQLFSALLTFAEVRNWRQVHVIEISRGWKHRQVLHHVLAGKPIPLAVLTIAVDVLCFKTRGLYWGDVDTTYFFMFQFYAQIIMWYIDSFLQVYNLLPMEPGPLTIAIYKASRLANWLFWMMKGCRI